MEKKRILIVTHEIKPYLILSEIARITNALPIYLLEQGFEIRVMMPRFGHINERRHRLHEVVRLSGINIIIDEDDYPLIIKVASLPGARLQVYFLDNEDFFKRKHDFTDEKGNFYADNAERMIFFCKGVMETIKKFGWPPDILHCHGWMTSLIPMYMKTTYKKEPVFHNTKMVYSVYPNQFEGSLNKIFNDKAMISKDIKATDFAPFKKADNISLTLGGMTHADALIVGSDKIPAQAKTLLKTLKKPILQPEAAADLNAEYLEFYKKLWKK